MAYDNGGTSSNMSKRLAPLVLALGFAQSAGVLALGLGELTLQSNLNEPLNARVDLLDTEGLSDDQVRIRLATEEDFDRLGLERAYFLTSIQFEVRIDGAKGHIQINSREPVLEPYLDFIIEARWPDGRLLREYTVLIDPPAFSASTPVASARQEVTAAEAETAKKLAPRESGAEESGSRVSVGGATGSGTEDRPYTRGASVLAAPGSEYLIQRNDTLWSIASRAQPQGVSVHQTMLEIQRMNPDAFIDGNINQIKAGYVIYLPQTGDIGSDSYADAVRQVRAQNRAWRDDSGTGPSLRISSELEKAPPEPAPDSPEPAVQSREPVAASAQPDSLAINERLAALEGQLDTLQSIVRLKDDQIAALQVALAESQATAQAALINAEARNAIEQPAPQSQITEPKKPETIAPERDEVGAPSGEASAVQVAAASEPVAENLSDAAVEAIESTTSGGGPMQYLTYGLSLLTALAVAVFLVLYRRRNGNDDATDELDAFADVTLEDSELVVDEVDPPAESSAPMSESPPPAKTQESLEELLPELEPEPSTGATEPVTEAVPSYQRYDFDAKQHDQYASDMETGDALAEADIYIAYGRYPQAVDLLKTAINSDPGNAAFRLKLLELCADMNSREEAQQQYADLEVLGDDETLARARVAIERAPEGTAWLESLPPASAAVTDGAEATKSVASGDLDEALDLELSDDLELPELDDILAAVDLTADTGEELEQEFSELAIEQADEVEDDLDLSKDFLEPVAAQQSPADEEMVFAAEGDEASTKLDLARAYLDMGDEEGARQILEEVAAEAEGAPRDEAQELLAKLG